MIKVPSYLDFFAKLVSYLGIDFDEEKYANNKLKESVTENKITIKSDKSDKDYRITNKFRIKELNEFNGQVELYNKDYLPKIIDLLSGGDEGNKQAITCFLNVIESLMRYLNDKNYYTIASNKRAMWGLFIFYYIPQFACMLSTYKNEHNIPNYLIDNNFMLPIFKSSKIVTPIDRLKKYLKEKGKVKVTNNYSLNCFTDIYLGELRKKRTPSYRKKFEIFSDIKKNNQDKDSPIIHEIESIFNCAVFTSNIYQELRKFFKNEDKSNDNCAELLIYFRECFDTCNNFYGNNNIENSNQLKKFILFHWNSLEAELNYISNPFIKYNKRMQNKSREALFPVFNSYLLETTNSEVDIFEKINTNDFSKGVLRNTLGYIINDIDLEHHAIILDIEDIEHNEIIFYLEELEYYFSNPEAELNEELITETFEIIKGNNYFKNYEHEFLFYEGLNYLAKNEVSEAINNLKIVCDQCRMITAAKTMVRASELLIVLYLLKETKTDYYHLNPEIKKIIDSQPEEHNFKPLPYADEAKKNKEIYEKKAKKLINDFNINEYRKLYPENKFGFSNLNPENKIVIEYQKEDWFVVDIPGINKENNNDIYVQKFLKIQEYLKSNKYLCSTNENIIGYSHIVPKIETVIDFQSDGLVLIVSPKPDEAIREKEIYLEKILKIIKKFNIKGYCHYKGIECKKYNPLKKMDEWITGFFKLYDDEQYSSETEEIKLEQVIKMLMKGRNAKYSLKKTIVTLLQYTPLDALQNNVQIDIIYRDLKVFSPNMERLLNSPPIFLNLLTKTIENLDG